MKYKVNFKFEKRNIEISYFKLESMTDFDYTVANLSLISLKRGGNFFDEFIEFSKSKENSLVDLMKSRFDYIFQPKGKTKQKLLSEVELAIENSSKLKASYEKISSLYIDEINSYIIDNEIISHNDLDDSMRKRYTSSKIVYNEFEVKGTNSYKEKLFDIVFSDDLSKFTFEKYSNQEIENEELIALAKGNIIDESIKMLPDNFDLSNCEVVRQIPKNFTFIDEFLNEKSRFEYLPIENNKPGSAIMLFNSKEDMVILNKIVIYCGVPFSTMESIEFSEFWKDEKHSNGLRSLIENKIHAVSKKVIESVVRHSSSKNDLKFLLDYIDPSYNYEEFSGKVDISIKLNQEIYQSKSYVLNNLVNMISKESYYEYINKFMQDEIENIPKHKWISLISSINEKDKTILSIEHRNQLDEYLIEKDKILGQITTITGQRKYLREEINKVTKKAKEIISGDFDKNLGEEIRIEIDYLNSWKKVIHTLVHFEDNNFKKAKESLQIIDDKSLLDDLLDLKKRYSSVNRNNIDSFSKLLVKDIDTLQRVNDILNNVEKRFNKFSEKIEAL